MALPKGWEGQPVVKLGMDPHLQEVVRRVAMLRACRGVPTDHLASLPEGTLARLLALETAQNGDGK